MDTHCNGIDGLCGPHSSLLHCQPGLWRAKVCVCSWAGNRLETLGWGGAGVGGGMPTWVHGWVGHNMALQRVLGVGVFSALNNGLKRISGGETHMQSAAGYSDPPAGGYNSRSLGHRVTATVVGPSFSGPQHVHIQRPLGIHNDHPEASKQQQLRVCAVVWAFWRVHLGMVWLPTVSTVRVRCNSLLPRGDGTTCRISARIPPSFSLSR